MMKACVAASVVVAISLLAGAGCSRNTSESSPQVQEIKASLAKSAAERPKDAAELKDLLAHVA